MADEVKVIVGERNFADVDALEESTDTDIALLGGLKTTATNMTFEDATNGKKTLSNLLISGAGATVLEELLDVFFDSAGPQDGQLLIFQEDSTGGFWTLVTPGDDIPATQTWTAAAGSTTVGVNSVTDLGFGDEQATGGLIAIRPGEIVGLSIAISGARTAGIMEGFVTLNGVSQNGAGEMVMIDAVNPTHDSVLYPEGSTIPFPPETRLGLRTETINYGTGGGKDVAMAAYIRNTA